MDNTTLENEIIIRMNTDDFSINSSDLIELITMFDTTEEEVVLAYNEVVNNKLAKLNNTGDYVMDYFEGKNKLYPSFEDFKKEFEKYDHDIGDNIIKNMHKKKIEDKNQRSLFGKMIKEELGKLMNEFVEDDDFDSAVSKITKNWGGAIDKHPDDELSPADIFDVADAGGVAQQDIEDEFGKDEFTPMGNDEYSSIMGISEEGEEGMKPKGMFLAQDAEGNEIKRHTIVTLANGIEKKGRVTGFGDDGQGNQIVTVDWLWPTDLNYQAPEEMGEKKELPMSLIVQAVNEELNLNEMNEEINEEINEELNEEQIEECGEMEEELEESRGLGHTVKNNGDRNVKKDPKDHSHAPVTTPIKEGTLNNRIKTLSEGSVNRKGLMNFINEEAKKLAEDIRKEEK